MTLIKCPECGKEIEISDGANVFPNCGYPISEIASDGAAKIKFPQKKIKMKASSNFQEKLTIKKLGFIIVAIGIVMLIVGIAMKTPGTALTTHDSLNGDETRYGNGRYSSIEEYVGGDAYNYIIGASLIGGEIAGMIAAKTICITVGILIVCIGTICVFLPIQRPTEKASTVLLLEEAKEVSKPNL